MQLEHNFYILTLLTGFLVIVPNILLSALSTAWGEYIPEVNKAWYLFSFFIILMQKEVPDEAIFEICHNDLSRTFQIRSLYWLKDSKKDNCLLL